MEQRHTDIISFVRESKTYQSGNNIFLELRHLTDEETNDLKNFFGIDFADYVRSMDDAGVRHAFRRHKNITERDFLLINYITDNYDFVCHIPEEKKVIYSKKIAESNGTRKFYYVEYIQTGKKRLAMKTLYKTRIL